MGRQIGSNRRRTNTMNWIGISGRLIFVAALAALAGLPAEAAAEDAGGNVITVTGHGSVSVKSDAATVELAVVNSAATARAALAANSAAVADLLKRLAELGYKDRDLATTRFDVSPQYKRASVSSGRTPADANRIVAYMVTNQLRVKVANAGRLGALLDEAVGAGANRISGIRFTVSQPERFREQAMREAVADARRRAEIYADAAGVGVGPVLRISETGSVSPQPRLRQFAELSAVSIKPGQREITASVVVVFALAPPPAKR
jgi:uncharacterized protein YggE